MTIMRNSDPSDGLPRPSPPPNSVLNFGTEGHSLMYIRKLGDRMPKIDEQNLVPFFSRRQTNDCTGEGEGQPPVTTACPVSRRGKKKGEAIRSWETKTP